MGRFPEKYERLCAAFHYRFQNMQLLEDALTHPSFAYEHLGDMHKSYQRLEFVGDRVINLVATRKVYVMFPALPEGKLNEYLKSLVSNNRLAIFAKRLRLDQCIFTCNSMERRNVTDYMLACVFEAIIGAIFIDSGANYPVVEQALNRTLLRDARMVAFEDGMYPQGRLKELARRKYGIPIMYEITYRRRTRTYHVRALLDGICIGEDSGVLRFRTVQRLALRIMEETHGLDSNMPTPLLLKAAAHQRERDEKLCAKYGGEDWITREAE